MSRVPLALALLLACASRIPEPTASREPGVPRRDSGIRSLDEAIGRYKSERYAEATWGFREIAAGRIEGDPRKAEFWLAKGYFRLDDHARAIAILVAIAGDPEHPFYVHALPWLAHLREYHPDDARVMRAIASYPLSILDEADLREVQGDLRLAFAIHRLRSGDPGGAWEFASAVSSGSDAYREAQLIAGLAADRLGQRAQAIAHLQIAATSPERTRRRRQVLTPRQALEESVRARARRELEHHGVRPPG